MLLLLLLLLLLLMISSFAILPNHNLYLYIYLYTDPFIATVKLGQQHPLLLFEEHPNMFNTHWLTDIPIKVSRSSSNSSSSRWWWG
jgi:hypothetical protein